MSFINGSPLAGSGSTPAFDFQRPQGEFAEQNAGSGARAAAQYGDGLRNNPIALPIAYPNQNPGSYDGDPSSAASSTGSATSSYFLSSIMNSISNLMQQLASYFGSQNPSGSASGNAAGYTGAPAQPSTPQTAFSNVTASSTGDPHEALAGTTSAGATVSEKWDSMKSHGDLLDSDSFRGGYQVSTIASTPDAKGITYNSSATVTTHGGNDAVTLNKDGSYAVTENGQNIALTQGQATQVGRNESVTLNADRSLTVVDSNRAGGSLTTTLSLNGNGVDVNAAGTNVDLGGYLVHKADREADPAAVTQAPSGAYGEFLSRMQQPSPMQYGGDSEPLGAGELEFA